jgi:uncharacterized protein (DUF362 family)
MKSRVVVLRCDSYDTEQVYKTISKGFDLLGGIAGFIKPAEKILLKPNLLNRAAPERAVTTHPAVVEAMIRLLLEKNYTSLSYGDSPGHPGSGEKTAEICGIKTVADKYKLSFSDFSKGTVINFPEGNTAKAFEICNAAQNNDAIINICKMKTHQLERITGAVKNSLGCVCGLNKAKMHIKYPNPDSFGKMLVDLNRYLKVRLHIMDGITAMEGNGPMSGDSVQMNCILISADPVALDAVFCRIIGLDPYLVPTNKFGEEFGLGNAKESNIEILGDGISALVNDKYKVDRSVKKTAKRPVIIKDKCRRCGLCIDSCPVEGKALRFPNGDRAKVPIYDYDKCIRCYCCQELCPEKAITIKTPFLGRIF